MHLNLDNYDVVEISANQAIALIEEMAERGVNSIHSQKLIDELHTAQEKVRSKTADCSFVIVKII